MIQKPSLPQGTRDFNASTLRKRQYLLQIIRHQFELQGFQPLETPAMEQLDTLTGKYGEEGDQLMFKILNNGLQHSSKQESAREGLEKVLAGKNTTQLTERALRYDLTIPFARYVAMNYSQLTFPFRRYQVQPVWRADRPQRGRYREFYQCDADIVGSRSLINEVCLLQLYISVFAALKVPVRIKLNNRKILAALAVRCGALSLLTPMTMAIDKLDKIGLDKVNEELAQRGFTSEQTDVVNQFLAIKGDPETSLAGMKALVGDTAEGRAGLEELQQLISYHKQSGGSMLLVEVDFTLARGLNYYTGTIFEVQATGVTMGSIGGGGRYDDLTGIFGLANMPGVGISFGVDRIYDVMEELGLFPDSVHQSVPVLFFYMGETEALRALELAASLRAAGIGAEVYPEKAKLDKQFKFAEKKDIPFIAIIGSEELQKSVVQLKELATGQQTSLLQQELATELLRRLSIPAGISSPDK